MIAAAPHRQTRARILYPQPPRLPTGALGVCTGSTRAEMEAMTLMAAMRPWKDPAEQQVTLRHPLLRMGALVEVAAASYCRYNHTIE